MVLSLSISRDDVYNVLRYYGMEGIQELKKCKDWHGKSTLSPIFSSFSLSSLKPTSRFIFLMYHSLIFSLGGV